jgi:SAM-dependent methyltransferase
VNHESDKNEASGKRAAPLWSSLLVCPDCHQRLETDDAVIRCDRCGRSFDRLGNALCLLPGQCSGPVAINPPSPYWQAWFIGSVYSRAKRSREAGHALARVLSVIGPTAWGLNAGSSSTRLHPRLINLDICSSPEVDVIGTAEQLPFDSGTLCCIVSQEVLEHVADPERAVREAFRVLMSGGQFYIQTPFILGVHGAPNDFWRFTDYGLHCLLVRAGFIIEELALTYGAGTALYQVAVEYVASIAAAVSTKLYKPVKGIAAILATPLRLANLVTSKNTAWNRIPAGYFAVARKP